MRVLILDDQRDRHDGFMAVFNEIYPDWEIHRAFYAAQALRAFEEHTFDLAFFDHDLGQGYEDGSWVVSQMLYSPEKYHLPKVAWTHTANWQGGRNIASKFEGAGVPCYECGYDSYFFMENLRDRPEFEATLATLRESTCEATPA